MVYLTTISMYLTYYCFISDFDAGNSKSETESMKIKKLKMIAWYLYVQIL